MPITANGNFNNPQIGAAFQNIASMFAPPTIQEQAAGQALIQSRAQIEAAQAAAAAKAATIGTLRTQYPGSSVADLYSLGDSDAVAHSGALAQQRVALQNPTNLSAQDALNYANKGTVDGTVSGTLAKPLSTDQVQYLPGALTGGSGTTTRYGVLKNGDRSTLLPGGQLPSLVGAPPPASLGDEDGSTAAIVGGLAKVGKTDNGVTRAANGITSIDAPDKPDTVDSQMAAYFGTHQPAFEKYIEAKSQPGGQNININNKAEGAVEAGYGKAVGEDIGGTITTAAAAPQALAEIARIRAAVKEAGGNLTTGPGAEYVLKGKEALGNLLGMQLPGTSAAEVINNIGYGLAAQATHSISARPSQFEFSKALAVKPGLSLSPEGLQAVLNIKEQDLRDQQNLAELASDPKNRANWTATKAAYYARTPVMSPFDPSKPLGQSDVDRINGQSAAVGTAPAVAGPAQIKSVDEYNALPAGAQYIAPGETNVRTKR